MPHILFYLLALVAVAGAVMLVAFRNPVSSALAMVMSFTGMAGLFIGLDAFLIGIVQILVYAGAIMVLFLFIIMLLDLKSGEKRKLRLLPAIGGVALAVVLVIQLSGVLGQLGGAGFPPLDLAAAAAREENAGSIAESLAPPEGSVRKAKLPDVRLIGREIFTRHNLDLQIVGTLLLVATVGVVVLTRRTEPENKPQEDGKAAGSE